MCSASKCFRAILSIFIFLNMLIGLALVGGLIWMYLDGSIVWEEAYGFNVGPIVAEINEFHYLLYSLLILGALKVFMSFIGCCSVSRKFIIPVLLLFGIQIAGGVCVWYFKVDFTRSSTDSLTRYIQREYGTGNTRTDAALNALQAQKSCCGSRGPADYSAADFNVSTNENNTYLLPDTCCINTDVVSCNESRTIKDDFIPEDAIYQHGCIHEILYPIYVHVFRYETLGAYVGYIVFEFLVLALKVLACRKRFDDYENSNMMELKPYR